jgi:hypothetical protein
VHPLANLRPTIGDAAMLEPEMAGTLPQPTTPQPASDTLQGLINETRAKGYDTSALEAPVLSRQLDSGGKCERDLTNRGPFSGCGVRRLAARLRTSRLVLGDTGWPRGGGGGAGSG